MTAFFDVHLVLTIVSLILGTILGVIGIRALRAVAAPVGNQPGQDDQLSPFWALVERATLCYMKTVTHREMRNQSGEILRDVAAGETIEVTNGGIVAAVMVPPGSDALSELISRGQAKAAASPLASLRLIKRTASALTSAEILADSRGQW